ncbi:MAG: type II secretion system protein [Pseudomonadota bacterium]|nr:type II secretion system protein [Pseudomonadota bacterium]
MRNKLKQNAGFTLVELIAVVAIISMIAVYVTIEINQSSDDAKVGLATAFLTSNVPSAISSYRARHMANCRSITNYPDDAVDLNGDGDYDVADVLIERGLAPTTPWGDTWVAEYSDETREITIRFPFNGTNAEVVRDDILVNLTNRPQMVSVEDGGSQAGGATSLTVVYSCS